MRPRAGECFPGSRKERKDHLSRRKNYLTRPADWPK